jgi:hypothetical protein
MREGLRFSITFALYVKKIFNFAKAVKQEKIFCDFRICGSKEKELSFVVLSQFIAP